MNFIDTLNELFGSTQGAASARNSSCNSNSEKFDLYTKLTDYPNKKHDELKTLAKKAGYKWDENKNKWVEI